NGAWLALEAQLRQPLAALEALYGVFIASEDVTPAEMRLGTRAWLTAGGLQAMGWSERLPRDRVPAFQAARCAAGARSSAEVVAIHYIEPLTANVRALGLNQLSVPAARAAIERARQTGE